MLTYNERSWLAWKKRISQMKNVSAAWCHKCPQHGRNAAGCYGEPYCPLFPDMQDALEYEGRVAAKLAEAYGTMMDHNEKYSICQTCRFEVVKTLGCMSTCAETVLRWAQLEVEEEMDNDMDI